MVKQTINSLVACTSRFEKFQNFSANPDVNTINIIGLDIYQAEYGNEFNVTVTSIDKNGKLVDEDYTYKVKQGISEVK
ncbi:hypothetical protein QMA40_30130 (plasmid) [Bacillus thuringiensis]|uniref:hypothetical protein n=1 Tax=Bacillus thuringiensis TaxID=1428 RepID=UPI003977BBB5